MTCGAVVQGCTSCLLILRRQLLAVPCSRLELVRCQQCMTKLSSTRQDQAPRTTPAKPGTLSGLRQGSSTAHGGLRQECSLQGLASLHRTLAIRTGCPAPQPVSFSGILHWTWRIVQDSAAPLGECPYCCPLPQRRCLRPSRLILPAAPAARDPVERSYDAKL